MNKYANVVQCKTQYSCVGDSCVCRGETSVRLCLADCLHCVCVRAHGQCV